MPAAKSLKQNTNEAALFRDVALGLPGRRTALSLLGLRGEARSGKHSGLHLDVVMRVQTLANGVVGVLPLRDDGGQTAEHPGEQHSIITALLLFQQLAFYEHDIKRRVTSK